MRAKTVACPDVLTDEVRRRCAQIAASARHVTIDRHASIALGGKAGLDTQLHFLEGTREEVARYIFILDAINFGSGWFAELGVTTDSLTERLTAHARSHGPWTPAQLRALDPAAVASTLALPAGSTLARALRQRPQPARRVVRRRARDGADRRPRRRPRPAPDRDAVLRRRGLLQARPDHRQRPAPGRRGGLRRHRPPDDLRRQPRPARPAPGRRAALQRRARGGDRHAAPSWRRAASSSARSAPAPCTPATRSRSAPACPSARSTTGSGTAVSARRTARPRHTSPAPCSTEEHGRVRGTGRRARVPDVHRHRARPARLPGRLHHAGQHRPAAVHRLPVAQEPHLPRRPRRAGPRRPRGARRRRRPGRALRRRDPGRGRQVRPRRLARGPGGRADPRALRRTGSSAACSSASTPATTTRSCSSRSPASPASRPSSPSTARSGSIPGTRREALAVLASDRGPDAGERRDIASRGDGPPPLTRGEMRVAEIAPHAIA